MMLCTWHWILGLFMFGNINWVSYTIFLIYDWKFNSSHVMFIMTAYMKQSSLWEFCIFSVDHEIPHI